MDDLADVVEDPFRDDGAGGPPRNPVDILKALVVKHIRNILSERSYAKLKSIGCNITYFGLLLFRERLSPKMLEKIMDGVVDKLRCTGVIKVEIVMRARKLTRAKHSDV